jgi:hypothetical protein
VNPTKSIVCGSNILDQETILPIQGWVKQVDGSWYVASAGTPYNKVLWQNTIGYKGQISLSVDFKRLNTGTSGAYLQAIYTDLTTDNIATANTQSFSTTTWTSNSAKTIDKIIWVYGSGTNSTWVQNIMLSYGATSKTYIAYSGTITPISLTAPLFSLDIKDEFDFISGIENHPIKRNIYNGSESGWALNTTGTNTYRFVITCSDSISQSSGYCSHAAFVTSGVSNDEVLCGVNNGNLYLRLPIALIDSQTGADALAKFKSWLTSNNVTVLYKLATPVTYTKTAANIAQPSLTANITTDGAPVSVDYTKDLTTSFALKAKYSYDICVSI